MFCKICKQFLGLAERTLPRRDSLLVSGTAPKKINPPENKERIHPMNPLLPLVRNLISRLPLSKIKFDKLSLDHPAIFADSLAVFAAPKRIGLKSHIRLPGVLVNSSSITSPDVSTYLRPG